MYLAMAKIEARARADWGSSLDTVPVGLAHRFIHFTRFTDAHKNIGRFHVAADIGHEALEIFQIGPGPFPRVWLPLNPEKGQGFASGQAF